MPSTKRSAASSPAGKEKVPRNTSQKGTWFIDSQGKQLPSLMVYHHGDDASVFSAKIAGFDMDHTLLLPKSGAKFPKNRSDWKYMFEGETTTAGGNGDDIVKTALTKAYSEEGYRIVIFTNQAGIEKKKQKQADIQGKIEDLESSLGIPITAFCACANDHYRKPTPAMWDLLEREYNGSIAVDRKASFYCGDAAGRPKGWEPNAKRDFSSGDRSFAMNVGVPFLLPEEFFLGRDCSKVPYEIDGVDPSTLLASKQEEIELPGPLDTQEIVVFVGLPASGKSTLYRKRFSSYAHINRDLMGTKEKCLRAAETALGQGQSIVVDNTNPAIADRKPYIELARFKGIPVRCLLLETSREVSEHNNFVRVKETEGAIRRIPGVAYNMYNKKFQEPSTDEGFETVDCVPFVPSFESDLEEARFLQRVEKL